MSYNDWLNKNNIPNYPSDSDYTTNAPSYYENLARKQKLIKLLAKKIWEYEELLDITLEELETRLQFYIESWDKGLEEFPDNVESLLQDWLSDGTLDHIINDTIFNWKVDQTEFDEFAENTTSQLAQTAINPDDFEGSDYEKVQTAITQGVNEKRAVRFYRMFDITGHTLKINNPVNQRILFHLMGEGGGIEKHDEGYVFETDQEYTGDVVSSNMKYISTSGVNTTIFNGNALNNGIIRLTSNDDTYRNVDHVITGNESHVQTLRFNRPTVTGGMDWAFEWKKSYDVTINDPTIEHRQHGIRNTAFNNNPDNDNFRLVNGVIEGLTGQAIDMGSFFGSSMSGTYFEANLGGDIDISKSNDYHNGFELSSLSFQPTNTQISNEIPSIKIGPIGSWGVFSSGNVSTGVLYEPKGNAFNSLGKLVSIGDHSFINKIISQSYDSAYAVFLGRRNDKDNRKTYAGISTYKYTKSTAELAVGGVETLTFNLSEVPGVSDDTLFSVSSTGTAGRDFTVRNSSMTDNDKSLRVNIKNDSTISQSVVVTVVVLTLG